MKKIKILHILQSANAMSVYSGNESIFFPLILGLSEKEEFDITLVIPGYNAALKKNTSGNITLHYINFRKKNFFKDIFRLKKILASSDFDIIHTHGTLSNFIIYLLCLATGKKYADLICSSRNKILFSKYMEYSKKIKQDFISLIEKKLMNFNDFNICTGKNIKSDYLFLGIHPGKLNLIEPAVDYSSGAVAEETIKKIRAKIIGVFSTTIKIVAIFGEFDRLKYGFDIFVKTAQYFKKTFPEIRVKFAVYGVSEINNLNDYLRVQNVSEDVAVIDNTFSPEEIIESIDILVLPYRYSEYPLSLLKALKHGKPSICSETSAFTDIIRDGANGFLAPIADYVYFAEKIACLCNDSEYKKISEEASATNLKKDYETMLSKYSELYHQYLSNATK